MNFQFFLFIYFYSNTYMLSYTQFLQLKSTIEKKCQNIEKIIYCPLNWMVIKLGTV